MYKKILMHNVQGLRCNIAALTLALMTLTVCVCNAQLTDSAILLAMANVENPEARGPLHIFKDKKKTTRDKLALYSVHGSLFNDDPAYNKKYPLWIPAAETFGVLGTVWIFDRYVSKEDYAYTSMETWKNNLAAGWEWDNDNLYLNFFMHPYSGAVFFNTARSNGYSFYESVPFAFSGGLLWEYFGENTLPSYNDIINTSITGPLIGEMQYRLSSNILNDKTTGSERFFREFGAALVDPVRGFNRLIQGTAYRKTSQEIYQKEPVNIVVSLGSRWANEGSKFGTGPGNQTVDVNLDYGYPFEYRDRKPFDYFRFWGDLYLGGAGDKVINNVMGYGILYGENFQYKNMEVLAGIFQHYNYWDTSTFELATIAFGGGLLTKLPLGKERSLLTSFHLGLIPLAGNNTIDGPTGSELRDYNYANGMQTELESTLKLGRLSLVFVGYYYWIHTFVGDKEDNFIGILKPRISFDINEFLSIGFEQLFYLSDRYPADFQQVHLKRTEQKLYISYFFQDPWYDR